MTSYAQQFSKIVYKNQKKSKIHLDPKEEEDEVIPIHNPNKYSIHDLHDWRTIEDKQKNGVNRTNNFQKNYEIIIHEDKKDDGASNLPYKSPLNDLFPLDRFNFDNSTPSNKLLDLVKVEDNNSDLICNETINEPKNKEEIKEIHQETKITRNRQTPVFKSEIICSIENDLNVTEEQMNDFNVEVKMIEAKLAKRQSAFKYKMKTMNVNYSNPNINHLKVSKGSIYKKRDLYHNSISNNTKDMPLNTIQITQHYHQFSENNNQIENPTSINKYDTTSINCDKFNFNPSFPTQIPYLFSRSNQINHYGEFDSDPFLYKLQLYNKSKATEEYKHISMPNANVSTKQVNKILTKRWGSNCHLFSKGKIKGDYSHISMMFEKNKKKQNLLSNQNLRFKLRIPNKKYVSPNCKLDSKPIDINNINPKKYNILFNRNNNIFFSRNIETNTQRIQKNTNQQYASSNREILLPPVNQLLHRNSSQIYSHKITIGENEKKLNNFLVKNDLNTLFNHNQTFNSKIAQIKAYFNK